MPEPAGNADASSAEAGPDAPDKPVAEPVTARQRMIHDAVF